ncbi:MAG TPA: hypothetical protein VG458_02360, partial [Solirubrobacterales bacterium]|nr:hypothetical protein [Solirubrobacterales bacterium]
MIGSAFYAEGSSDALFPADVQPVYNMPTPKGVLARFAFALAGRPTYIDAVLDPTDYSVIAQVKNIPSTVPVYFQQLNLWGVPGDPVHDSERYSPETGLGSAFKLPVKPFLSLPTECNVADTTDLVTLTSYANRETNVAEGLKSEPATLHGCDQLDFDPTVEVKPSTNVADAPAGLEFDLHIPQNEDPEGRATAHLKDAVVKLPPGMTVNPPSADGLGACSLEQIGLGTNDPVACPESSKLGTVEASSPAVDHPLPGSVYLAEQNRNPFGSLIAMYLVIEDPETGLLVKLPGRADLDPTTGQITATFKNNPQLPVEDLALKFFEGPRAALKTPTTCGNHTTQATFTPWSSPEGADAAEQSTFSLTQGPAGGACLPAGAQAPNSPAFSAGTQDPTAKAFSPFVLKLTRADGTQQLQGIDTLLPEGLTGKLAGIPYCSEASLAAAQANQGKAEQAAPSCPLASKVGIVNVGAGAGSTPLYVQGQAYLAGPYKGAPLSLAIVTPAVAGPFDLGTVVVRTALHVDPATAQIHAVSDPFPRILEGVPLNIRSIALRMDRPDFTLNPTSCDPMAITGSALSVFNQVTPLSERFQVGECSKLKFKPKLSLRLKGKTKRTGHPALTAVLTQPQGGQANIDRVSVVLPRAQFIDQGRIGEVCTRDQFAARACPAKSILGTATAYTPLLDRPLTGTVYLRANGGVRELPDMVAALRGQINVDLVGYVDAVVTPGTEISRIRNTFAIVPDAPVSKFVLRLNAGKKALLENSRNLCKSTQQATVRMLGQNGKAYDFSPSVKNDCAKKPKNGKGGKGKRG